MKNWLRFLCVFLALPVVTLLSVADAAKAQTNILAPPKVFEAIEKNDYELLRSQLLKGESPNLVLNDRITALMVASREEKLDLVELLLEFDALPNLQDKLGNTALFYAAAKNAFDVTDLLLQAGADPNIANRQGVTPFMTALATAGIDVVQMLIDAGADLTLQDYTGRSALEWAQDNRQPAIYDLIQREGGF